MSNKFFFWASDGNWTRDLIPTKDALYHLSYTGLEKFECETNFSQTNTQDKILFISKIMFLSFWARDQVRTGDIQLGRLTLYQLSYSRILNWNFCGESRIRTCEDVVNGVTVRPRWPLEYLPKISLFKWTYCCFFEPMEGLEPTTCWLQISCSSQLSYIGCFLNKNNPLFLTDCKCNKFF